MRRRDVLTGLFGAPLATQLLACSPPEVARLELDGRLRGPNHELGHRLRDPIDTSAWDDVAPEQVRVAIVGGGPAGLAAGWRLRAQGQSSVRVYEMEDVAGGTSRGGNGPVTRYPWGAHYLPVPSRRNLILRTLLNEMGALEDGEPAEHVLIREPDERVFFRGYWYSGLYPYAGASAEDLNELARFRALLTGYAARTGSDGRPAFSIPLDQSSRDPELIALDRMNAATFMDEHGFRSRRLRWLCDYACRDDYGLRLADTSAWALVFYWAARMEAGDDDTAEVLTWPEGNAALTRHMARSLRGRIDHGVMAVHVERIRDDMGEGVSVLLLTPSGARRKVRAQRVVLAVPSFIAKRIAPSFTLPVLGNSETASPTYGPWMVANMRLKQRPWSRGAPASWDNVIYDSPSVGYVSATHQRGRDIGPTVWTYYFPMCGPLDQARQHLFDAGLEEWQDALVLDLERAHPGLRQHIERIDIWRWGHGMIQPRVGFLGGGARFDAGRPDGPVHFAHSDLSGIALFEEAFHHGVRAADEILALAL